MYSPPFGEGGEDKKMTRVENHCCGCSSPGYPCIGSSCPERRVPVLYCDNKNCVGHFTGVDILYTLKDDPDGAELCMDCIEYIADRVGVDVWDLVGGEV